MTSNFMGRALGSAAIIALAVPGIVQAQAAPAPAPSSATAAAEAAGEADEIIVTGIRGSLQRAQDLKRNAPAVIEAVTFEDLGKFSDQNIADALQRVPGVQIERNDSGNAGDRAAIRGLGSQYVQVTVNDRTLVSFGNAGNSANGVRSFNLDQVPSEVIGGLTVYKTPIAETVEPGIGGLINIATLRPLDYKPPSGGNLFANATVRGEIDDIAKVLKPRYSGGVGVKLFDNTLGIYVSGLISDTRTRTDTINQSNFITNLTFAGATPGAPNTVLNRVIGNNGQEVYTNDFDRKRRTGSIGVQWKPTPNLDIYADFTYNKYSNNQERRNVSLATNRSGLLDGILRPGEVTVEDGVVTGFTSVRNGSPVSRYSPQNQFTQNESRLLYGGVNAKWTSDRATITFDYGHSEVKYDNSLSVIYADDIPLNYSVTQQNGLPRYTINQNVASNALQAFYYFDAQRILDTDRNSFRLDGEYELNDDWKIKVGARYERTRLDSRSGSAFYLLPRSLIAFGISPPGQATYASDDFGDAADETFTAAELDQLDSLTFPTSNRFTVFPELGLPELRGSSYSGFCQIADFLCSREIRNGSLYGGAFPTSNRPAAGDLSNDLPLSANDTIFARERNAAIYGSLEGKAEVGGIPIDGNVGVRAVNIKLVSQAFAALQFREATGANTPGRPDQLVGTRDTNKYWEVLPNLNLNAHPAANVNLRFAVGRSITLPEYIDTAPSGVLTIVNPLSLQYDPNIHRNRGNFGNTQLKPISSWNFDLTGEYYTGNGGSIIVSLFYKDVHNLILNTFTRSVPIPGQTALFDVNGARNIANASVKGFEIGTNQPFTFLPAPFDGLGVQANYTYVDSNINSGLQAAAFGFPGSSKHNANVIAYYEKYGLGVRLGYTYRSRNLLGTGGELAILEDPISNLDLNVSYLLTKNVEIIGSILNLTGESRRNYASNRLALSDYYNRPRLYTFGARVFF